jgi:hypothetical protein
MVQGRSRQITHVSRRADNAPRPTLRLAIDGLDRLTELARGRLHDRVTEAGPPSPERDAFVGVTPNPARVSAALLQPREISVQALAYLASQAAAARALQAWSERGASSASSLARRTADAFAGDLMRRVRAGVAVSLDESVSLLELDVTDDEVDAAVHHGPMAAWASAASASQVLRDLAEGAWEAGVDGPIGREDDPAARGVRDLVRDLVCTLDGASSTALAAGMERLRAPLAELLRCGGWTEGTRLSLSVATEELARGSLPLAALARPIAPPEIDEAACAHLHQAASALGVAQAGLEAAFDAARGPQVIADPGSPCRAPLGPPLSRGARVGARLGALVVGVAAARRLVLAAASEPAASRQAALLAGMSALVADRAAAQTANACADLSRLRGSGQLDQLAGERLERARAAQRRLVLTGTPLHVIAHAVACALLS